MKIVLASDHAGFSYKNDLKKYLENMGYEVVDLGTDSSVSSDYPDFGSRAAKDVAGKKADRAILVCGSGIGMCIVANRFKGVRAAVIRDENEARLAREHNDANVACFGSRMSDIQTVKKLTGIFLKTEFEGGRHKRRVEKIDL